MSTSSQAALGAIRIQAQQRADLENNQAVTTAEWNQYISQSYKELTDLLVAAYGDDYYVATNYQFSLTGANQYALPDGSPNFINASGGQAQKFYKLLGVDLQYSASPSGWISLRRFEFLERNKLNYPNTAVNYNGYSNLRYRLEGDNIIFVPYPMAAQQARIWYIPAPTSLQFMLPCGTTLNDATLTLADTTGLTVGMQVYPNSNQGLVRSGATIQSIGSTSIILTSSCTATVSSAILSFWDDSTLMEGISGWEEYVVIDAAIKAQIKQEGDYAPLGAQKQAMMVRIEAMANGRDAGQAQHVTDAMSVNNFGLDGSGDGGWFGS